MTFIRNKKVHLDYEIIKKFEAGIKLKGFEVKSVKNKQGSLDGSYVSIKGDEAFILKAQISPYQAANTPEGYDPYRERKLLLTKKEIRELGDYDRQKGLTIVPISLYNKGKKIKVEIAVVRGKKKYDKRETIKKRDMQRDVEREVKHRF